MNPSEPHSLPAFQAPLFPFFQLIVIERIFLLDALFSTTLSRTGSDRSR
jgi:hypothetical protein